MKKQQKAKQHPTTIQSNAKHKLLQPEHATKVLGIVAALCVVAHLTLLFVIPRIIGVPVFSLRMWGVHFIAYYPIPVIVAFYAVALALCIPAVSICIYRFCSRLFDTFFRNGIVHRKQVAFICISFGAVFCFRLFNAKYALLGDGLLRVDNVVHNTFLHNEWGTVVVMHLFYKAVHSISAIGDVEIVKLFTNICGGFFVYTVLNIGDVLGRTKFEKVAVVIMYVSFGTIQHFCGYVEVYALTAVVLTVYFYTGILCLRGKLHWLIPVTVFSLGALCHLITIMFFPSLLYILYAVQLRKYRFFRNPLLWILGFAVCIVASWSLIVNRIVPELYPLSSQTGDIVTLFSLRHFCEYCNGIVLGCGFLLVITVACAAYAWYVRLKLNSEHWFFIVASASIATCIFLFRGILGSSDWDTLSFAALAINLLGILLLLTLFKGEEYRLFLRYACVVITGLMVLESGSWVVLNRGDRSIQRFEDAIMTDPGFYYVGHPRPMYVSIVLNNNNLKDEAIKFYKLAYEQYPDDPRCGFNYIMALCIRKQPEQANAVLAELTKRSPDYAAQRMRIMFTVAQNEHQELFTTLALKQYYLEYCKTPDIINAYFTHEETINNFKSLVELLMQKNDFFNAEPVVNTILKLEPGNGINYFMLAKIVYGERKYDRTIDICNYIITSIPNIPLPYQLKANALVQKHKNDMAVETLRKGLSAVKENAQKKDLQASLDSLLMGKTDMKN